MRLDQSLQRFRGSSRDVDLYAISLLPRPGFELEFLPKHHAKKLNFFRRERVRIDDSSSTLMRFHRTVVHEPCGKSQCGQIIRDSRRYCFPPVPVEEIPVFEECFVGERMEAVLVIELARHLQECAFLPEGSTDPLLERVVQPLDVLSDTRSLFDFETGARSTG